MSNEPLRAPDAKLTDDQDARRTVEKLHSLLTANPRLVAPLARTMLGRRRDPEAASGFETYHRDKGFEFTSGWAGNNIPFIAPILRQFLGSYADTQARYLEIGAYEGQNLAFMDWMFPGRLDVTVIDPWFDEALNPEDKYHDVEPRFQRNLQRMALRDITTYKGFSTYELPKLLEAEQRFDLIYIDGSHTALAVLIDLCYCASLLDVGGMMVLDDYWHDKVDAGGPGVKQAVDSFYAAFRAYFDIVAVYRQVVMTKGAELPR